MIQCEDLSCDSGQGENSTTFLWVVKDVIKFPIQHYDNYISSFCDIKLRNSFESTCRILLCPTVFVIDLEVQLEKCTQGFFVSFSIGILDRELNRKYEVTKSYHYLSSGSSFKFEKFLSQELLFKHKESLLHNEDLVLTGKFTVFSDCNHRSISSVSSCSHFSMNIGTLLKDSAFSDFSISVQEKKFRCHKVVLASRSAYFKALFDSGLKENETQELVVIDSEADVIEQVLSYIYTNTIDVTSSNIVPVLYAAEKYLLYDLKSICESKMHSYFSFDNWDELLKIVKLYNLPTVEIKALHMKFLFTKQIEYRNRCSTLNDIKVPEASKGERSYEISCLDVDSNNSNPEMKSNVNLKIELRKQEPFLPYADVWMCYTKRALFEHTWKIKNLTSLNNSGTSMTHTFSDDYYKASYKVIINVCYNKIEKQKIQYSVKLNFGVLSSQHEKSLIEIRCYNATVSGDLNVQTYFDAFQVEQTAEVFSVNIAQEDVDSLLHDGDLLVSCKCWIPSCHSYYHNLPEVKNNLIADVSSTYTSHKYSDLTIRVESSEFQCHKAVISCRSRFLAQMLEERKNEVTITLEDIDEKTFEKILRYIYTDQCDFVEADARELLPLASKYELEHLKVMCEKHLISSLTLENAAEALQVSILHSAPTLYKHALQYVGENFSRIFSNPDTVDQIWSAIFQSCNNSSSQCSISTDAK